MRVNTYPSIYSERERRESSSENISVGYFSEINLSTSATFI